MLECQILIRWQIRWHLIFAVTLWTLRNSSDFQDFNRTRWKVTLKMRIIFHYIAGLIIRINLICLNSIFESTWKSRDLKKCLQNDSWSVSLIKEEGKNTLFWGRFMTESRLYGATIAFECSKMKAKILELSKMALFQVDTIIKIRKIWTVVQAESRKLALCRGEAYSL